MVAASAAPVHAAQNTAAQAPQHGHQQATAEAPAYSPELLEELAAVRAATERFRDHAVAVAEGYEPVAGDGPLMGEHWFRHDLVHRPFDMTAPSTLQYLHVNGEYLLTGVAYTVYRAPDDPLPEGFAGEHDAWHVHDMLKISMTATEGRPLLRWITERRIESGRTRWDRQRPELTMVHAWVWLENPDGVFAQDHRVIPFLRAGLPATWGREADADAAQGVALLADDACTLEVRRTGFLTGPTWRQRSALASACAGAAHAVRSALAVAVDRTSSADASTLNTAAGEAWRGYLAQRAAILTDDQQRRLTVGIEHPGGHGR